MAQEKLKKELKDLLKKRESHLDKSIKKRNQYDKEIGKLLKKLKGRKK